MLGASAQSPPLSTASTRPDGDSESHLTLAEFVTLGNSLQAHVTCLTAGTYIIAAAYVAVLVECVLTSCTLPDSRSTGFMILSK